MVNRQCSSLCSNQSKWQNSHINTPFLLQVQISNLEIKLFRPTPHFRPFLQPILRMLRIYRKYLTNSHFIQHNYCHRVWIQCLSIDKLQNPSSSRQEHTSIPKFQLATSSMSSTSLSSERSSDLQFSSRLFDIRFRLCTNLDPAKDCM